MVQLDDRRMNLTTDLRVAITFCTRLPLGSSTPNDPRNLARASWAMPVGGAIVGVLGALAYGLASKLGLGASSGSALALGTTMLVTGCLHEDGLADTVDGFGGGHSRERKLAIMRDSRIGTFGVCALIVSFFIRWSAVETISKPAQVAIVLIVTHVVARAMLPALMRVLGPARLDGLSAQAGRPPLASVAIAILIAVATLALGIGPIVAMVIVALLASAGALVVWLSNKHIGGQTGDVLGALEQISEIVILLIVVSLQPWSLYA